MIASYIAAVAAFSVVNLGPFFGNAWWVWLWPVIVGVPAIRVWKNYYRRKFSASQKAPGCRCRVIVVDGPRRARHQSFQEPGRGIRIGIASRLVRRYTRKSLSTVTTTWRG